MLRITIMLTFKRFLWVGMASLALASLGLAQSHPLCLRTAG